MTRIVLPKLTDNASVKPPDRGGEWKAYPKAVFEDVAKSLDYKAPGESKKINAVPSMWALPMTLEIPIFNNQHPLRKDAIAQWQGMLGAIAFAKVRGFNLEAQRLDLDELRRTVPFAAALWQLQPDSPKSLHRFDNKGLWQEIFVWTWNGQPVGMTSPTTIVVPSAAGRWPGLPWWNAETGLLGFPQSHLSVEEKSLLYGWLENLLAEVNNPAYQGDSVAKNNIGGMLSAFRDSLGGQAAVGEILDRESPQFFKVPLNRGVFNGLNYPIKFKEIASDDSHVRILGSATKNPAKHLLLVDAAISEIWGMNPQDIRVHRDKTLASLNLEDLKAGRLPGWDDVRVVQPQDLFLPNLTFIDQEAALPGAFPLESSHPLVFNRDKITPIMPLNPLLMDYFTPEDLMGRIKFTQADNTVRISLNLPLKGTIEGGRPLEYQLVKEYRLEEQHKIEELPVLEIWPHLRVPNWQEYYAFYFADSPTFKVAFNDSQEPHTYSERSGEYIVTRLSSFPSHIHCQRDGYSIGFIPLRTLLEETPNASWRVGVDFGTSFTNIYVNRRPQDKGSTGEPLQLEKLHLQITAANPENRRSALFENFLPESFIPQDKPLPLASVLTKRGETNRDRKKVIYDGRIYVPERTEFNPADNWIETDLKWKNSGNHLFLDHLGLLVSALAAKSGVKTIQWSISYPSAFSKNDVRSYAKTWKDLTEDLGKRTSIEHLCPEQDDPQYFRTESLALAQYFADKEDCNLIRSACIDLGGGTSDISVWQENTLIHQCSIQLAGKHLLAQFLEQRPALIAKWFKRPVEEWSNLEGDKFKAKIDSLLRYESDNWLKNERPQLEDDRDFQGLVRLMAIGTAGIYYYLGLILNTLTTEEKYTETETPAVYIGGNGSRLLHWLTTGGNFSRHSGASELFNRMVADASGLKETGSNTQISQRPKDEAACGLVMAGSKLKGLDRKAKDPLIAGENCRLNGQEVAYNQRMVLDDEDISKIEVPASLERLVEFINSFNRAIKDLEIDEEIKPFAQYQRKTGLEPKYAEELLGKTHTELRRMLLDLNDADGDKLREEPPFILGLKALLRVLAKEWAGR
jgi:hypothetical protein